MGPLVLITGFGSFPGRPAANPSREIAAALESSPPARVRVRGAEIPVSFERAPAAIDELLDGLRPQVPDLLLGLGVQRKPTFRLERRARGRLRGRRRDNDGATALELEIDAGPDLETSLDLAPLASLLRRVGAPEVIVSEHAGRYVCERSYHHLLTRGATLGIPALFLHVPPAKVMASDEQIPIVRALVEALAEALPDREAGRSTLPRP